ncbi:hypothetical protein [Luteimonas salinilitoris]|uniref:Uncharacterized protein n=1 Tax=Luteimonas salinilitoris TaxID=3237697 RepID=A0ABV4HRX9_9GAMM
MPSKPSTPAPRPTRARQGRNEAGSDKRLTSERISADLAAFRKSGGRVEVLGVTRTLTKIDGSGS